MLLFIGFCIGLFLGIIAILIGVNFGVQMKGQVGESSPPPTEEAPGLVSSHLEPPYSQRFESTPLDSQPGRSPIGWKNDQGDSFIFQGGDYLDLLHQLPETHKVYDNAYASVRLESDDTPEPNGDG